MGSTGTGKSTLANALINGPSNIITTGGDTSKFQAKIDIEYNDEEIFQIGHSAVAETKTPKFFPLDSQKSMYLVDGPGINDTSIKNEYSN